MEQDSVDISQLRAEALTFHEKAKGTAVSTRNAPNADILHAVRFGEVAESRNGRLEAEKGGEQQVKGESDAKQNVRAFNVSKVPRMSGGSASGDTQPLSQWVYDEYTMRNKGLDHVVENSTRDTETHHTLHTGQPGHVNLLDAFEQPDLSDGEGLDGVHEDGLPETTQNEVTTELFPEHKRFQVPKTPATNGKKRNFRGEVLKSGGTTPRLPVNPFGSAGNTAAMGLSQAFQATQAGTSPMAHLLPSDVPSTRPSPAFNHQHRPSTAGSLSSPAIMRHTGIQRATTEPQSKYVSMQESQAERRKRQQGQSTSSPLDKRKCEWGFSDDELDHIERTAQDRQKKRKRDAEARRQFATMAEPLVSRANTTPHQPKLLRQREPSSPTLRKAKEVSPANPTVVEPIDLTTDNLTEDETEHEDDPGEPEESSDDLDELADDDKENVGRRKIHIVTPRFKRDGPRTIIAYSSPKMRRRATPSPVIQGEVDELDADIFTHPLSQPRLPITIADSQSSQNLPTYGGRRCSENEQPQMRTSSPTSRTVIPQSQAALHTSQLDSSMKRHLSKPSPLFVASKATSGGSPNSKQASPRSLEKSTKVDVEEGFHKAPPAYGSSPPVPMAPPGLPISGKLGSVRDQNHSHPEGPCPTREQVLLLARVSDKGSSNLISKATPTSSPTVHPVTLRSTIPETSSVVRHIIHSAGNKNSIQDDDVSGEKSLQVSEPLRENNSRASTNFETANTHLSKSPTKISKQQSSHMSKGSQSPVSPAFTEIRKFDDIANDPTAPDEAEEAGIDVNLLTGDDLEFQSLIGGSSPIGPAMVRKRRTYERRTGSTVARMFAPSSVVASSSSAGEAQVPTDGDDDAAIPSSEIGQRTSQRTTQADRTTKHKERKNATSTRHQDRAELGTQIHHPPAAVRAAEKTTIIAATDEAHSSTLSNSHESDENPIMTTIASRRAKRKAQDLDSEDIDELAPSEVRPTLSFTSREKPSAARTTIQDTSSLSSTTTSKILAPTRVLAYFNASTPSFYPATCLCVVKGDVERLKVQFDDNKTVELHPSHVKRFELRPGDLVKLDRPGARAQTFEVQSVHNEQATTLPPPNPATPSKRRRLLSNETNKSLKTDIFGNSAVTVSLKQSGTTSTSTPSTTSETVSVESIYLPQSLFKKLKDRAYTHPAQSIATAIQTPSDISSPPSAPASRTRRNRASCSSFDAPPSASKLIHVGSGLFGNMIFSITNISDPKARSSLVKAISSNGGTVLESQYGFRELFVPDSASPPAEFALTPNAQGKGFTALLADRHCRLAKYIQALALGIPCLSPRWIQECLAASKLLAWEPYLLASGESSFLYGAVRSRLLPSYPPDTATLRSVISCRPQFLEGQNVLLFISSSAEIMTNYPFIARALGASKVVKATTFEEAKERLGEEKYDWIYFHDGEGRDKEKKGGVNKKLTVENIEEGLFGKGKKRKRGSKGDEEVEREGTRIVTTEFVVQSLILGSLLPGR